MRQDHHLLNHLDDPMRFLFFTMDEFIVIAVPLFIGMAVNCMFLGTIAALGLYQLLKFIKKSFAGANLRQLAYWFLPTKKSMLSINIPSCIREYQG